MAKSEIRFIQKMKINLVKRFIHRFMPPPVQAGHWEYSCIFSTVDDFSQPSERLLDLSSEIIDKARKIDLNDIANRFNITPINPNPNIWPGDHYKLLAALVQIIDPKVVIEIGTSLGTSALALKKYLRKNGKIITFDVVQWNNISNTLLLEEDFFDNRLIQITDDVSDKEFYNKHRKDFEEAELIFVDAKKDGIMENLFIANFNSTNFKNNPIIVFDDIKHWQMLKIWREINHPKIDITSFGHFTGTGMVEWKNK